MLFAHFDGSRTIIFSVYFEYFCLKWYALMHILNMSFDVTVLQCSYVYKYMCMFNEKEFLE